MGSKCRIIKSGKEGASLNWSAVKNLLIAILVAANLFLVYNIARQNKIRGYIPEDAVEGAVELLAERGLSVPVECIPLKKVKEPVYESTYSDEYYTQTAQTLSGSPREMLLALPEGGFSITAENGAVVDFDTEFGFRYLKNGISDEMAYTEITADSFSSYLENDRAAGGKRMKALSSLAKSFLNSCNGGDGFLTCETVGGFYSPEEDATYLLAVQNIGESDVYSHFAVCVFKGDELTAAYGRWYFGGLQEDYSAQIIDQVNILFSDLNELRLLSFAEYSLTDEFAETAPGAADTDAGAAAEPEEVLLPSVTSMNLCYITYWNADKTALYFMPAWQIDHMDGPMVVYNATNGTTYARK